MTKDITALIMLVPEADALVRGFWRAHRPSALAGIPPHITTLFPFVPADAIDETLIADLRATFAAHAPFDFDLTHIDHFPQAFYLAPEPAAPFSALTQAVHARFPEYPPFGGEFDDIIPHLTVVSTDNAERLMQLEALFSDYAAPHLPISARAGTIWLLEKRGGRWQNHTAFDLGTP